MMFVVLATLLVRASKSASCHSPIVVMEATEHRDRDDRARRVDRPRQRLLMIEPCWLLFKSARQDVRHEARHAARR